MADHEGYVFMSPTGRYLAREVIGANHRIYLTSLLDQALILPFSDLQENQPENWDFVRKEFKLMGWGGDLLKAFTPIQAKSFQRIEIGVHTDES